MPLSVLHISALSGPEHEPAPLLVTVAEDDDRATFAVTVPRGSAFIPPDQLAARLEQSGMTLADLRLMSTPAHH